MGSLRCWSDRGNNGLVEPLQAPGLPELAGVLQQSLLRFEAGIGLTAGQEPVFVLRLRWRALIRSSVLLGRLRVSAVEQRTVPVCLTSEGVGAGCSTHPPVEIQLNTIRPTALDAES